MLAIQRPGGPIYGSNSIRGAPAQMPWDRAFRGIKPREPDLGQLRSIQRMRRDGKPYRLNVERHLVVFAMTQWGKSNAERTMIYANKDDVAAGLAADRFVRVPA